MKFSFPKSVLGAPVVLENALGKSSTIPVCLSESCLSHDVTRALRSRFNACDFLLHFRICLSLSGRFYVGFIALNLLAAVQWRKMSSSTSIFLL